MGWLHLLKGEYDQAEAYLNKTAESGLRQARLNLEELAKGKDNIRTINKQDYWFIFTIIYNYHFIYNI